LLASGHQVSAVLTQPDRPAGRGQRLQASPVKRRALEHGLAVLQPRTLKDPATQAELDAFKADLMVVVAYGLLLPPAVLAIPRHGCMNVHASLLPRWRGAAPVQRAILAGDRETGVTIMQMDAGLDTGAMLVERRCAIGPEETARELHDRLAGLGAEALMEALMQLQSGSLRPRPQPQEGVTYAPKLDKAEADLDWSRPAVELARQVRAFNPWPVAQTRLDSGALRIWRARALEEASLAAAGTIVASGRDGIRVATGAGILLLQEVQPAGKRPMAAAAFANARNLQGARLGA